VRDASDIDGLADALRRAFELAAMPDTSVKARAIASRYDMDRMIDKTLALYAGLGIEVRA
jgi:hypothetical protein